MLPKVRLFLREKLLVFFVIFSTLLLFSFTHVFAQVHNPGTSLPRLQVVGAGNVNAPTVQEGIPIYIIISNIGTNAPYHLTIEPSGGGTEWHWLDIPAITTTCKDPSGISSPGVFEKYYSSWCTRDSNSNLQYYIKVNTDGFNCSGDPSNFEEAQCFVRLKSGGVDVTTPGKFSIIPNQPAEVTITYEGTIYQNSPEVITARGCAPGENVKFYWWTEGNFPGSSCNIAGHEACAEENGDDQVDRNSNNPATADSSGNASITKSFKNTGDYLIQAVCQNSKKAGHKTFSVATTGYETAQIIPEEPKPETDFQILLRGLEPESDLEDQCYFFKIKNLETDAFVEPPEGRDATCHGVSLQDKYGDRLHNNDSVKEFYRMLQPNGAEMTLDIPGLPKGLYRFELFIGNLERSNFGHSDKKSAWVEFGVGLDVSQLQPPPPRPPCANEITEASGGCNSVNTALGKISVKPADFIRSILGVLLSISGGIALLLIIYSGYKFMVSSGNPDAVQGAKDTLTSAIVGLLFIIFSLVILQVIGVDILHLPAFQP